MPRPKKGSPEAKAWGEQMKAKRQAKQTASEPKEDIIHNDDLDVLKAQIKELQDKLFFATPPPVQAPGVTSTKQVVTKYSFDPKMYPDPRQRLAKEDKLKRFAFDENYELNWEVQKVDYEEDGLKVRAPRFLLELVGKVIDEETNEIAKKYDPITRQWKEQRYVLKKLMMFEDPDSFIAVANDMGIEVPEFLEKPFLDEMRYMVMRDWLLENFLPPKKTAQPTQKDTVINNRLVTVTEVAVGYGEPTPELLGR